MAIRRRDAAPAIATPHHAKHDPGQPAMRCQKGVAIRLGAIGSKSLHQVITRDVVQMIAHKRCTIRLTPDDRRTASRGKIVEICIA